MPPFDTASVPERRLVPIEVVALTFPFASVERSALVIFESHVVPSVASVVED